MCLICATSIIEPGYISLRPMMSNCSTMRPTSIYSTHPSTPRAQHRCLQINASKDLSNDGGLETIKSTRNVKVRAIVHA